MRAADVALTMFTGLPRRGPSVEVGAGRVGEAVGHWERGARDMRLMSSACREVATWIGRQSG